MKGIPRMMGKVWEGRVGASVGFRAPLAPSVASCSPPANLKCKWKFIFLFSFFFVWKQLGRLRDVFTLIACPVCLQGSFSPKDIIFSLFFLFFDITRLPQKRFSTQWWDSSTSWTFSLESLFFYFFFFLQWVGEVQAKKWSTTITVLFKSSMNSHLERGFL